MIRSLIYFSIFLVFMCTVFVLFDAGDKKISTKITPDEIKNTQNLEKNDISIVYSEDKDFQKEENNTKNEIIFDDNNKSIEVEFSKIQVDNYEILVIAHLKTKDILEEKIEIAGTIDYKDFIIYAPKDKNITLIYKNLITNEVKNSLTQPSKDFTNINLDLLFEKADNSVIDKDNTDFDSVLPGIVVQ